MYTFRVSMLLLIGLFALVSLSIAEVPQKINYQGKLTDASGDPVADGNYEITFALYNDSLAGDKFWTESLMSVPVADGLFNVILGTTQPIPTGIIDTANVFLEITFNGETLQPRTRFVSVPYALAADKANALTNDSFLNETGDTLRGELYFHGGTGSGGRLRMGDEYANLDLADNGSVKTRVYGELYGEVGMFDPDGGLTISLRAPSTGGALDMYSATGATSIALRAGPATDNNTLVQLPSGSVDDIELMNEPGIASNSINTGSIIGRFEFADIQTVTITIPAPGYIYLAGSCYIRLTGDTATIHGVYVQIDETAGGTSNLSTGTLYTWEEYAMENTWRHSVCVQNTYYKAAAGTYEFRLEAMQYVPSGANYVAFNGQLTAIYLPTSYESVKTLVADPGDNPEAVPVVIRDEDGNPTGETRYQVDLRYYELKAKQARIEALEAERDLERARNEAARQ